ncbi:4a-hydroxytetrahydrobiopterin dehydratase [Patescibacteria group bacterium]|nr:4a-hydroxytetrahydrobiopterin dehydratase [Patescibacteria group bacterium]MCL5797653.1 4a-hydroxytetrahydrobiopterin dehydratase [Patescibacteria group bacterium]
MNNSLTSKKCIPCEGGAAPLIAEEIEKYMPLIPQWMLEEGKLVRRFQFKDFREAIAFVNKVADLAEREGHHPNISVYGWNKVKLTCFTHAIQGLHLNDFILAAKTDQIYLRSTLSR